MDRGTELRHWKESQIVSKTCFALDEFREPLPRCSFNPTESCPSDGEEQIDEDIEVMQYHSNNERDEDEDGSCACLPRAARTEKNATGKTEEKDPNPLRKLVVNAVLDALRIVKGSGSSCQTFEDILNYGKTLLLASHNSDNIDREIVLTLWPRNWNSVQKLLKEEGYEDAKLFYVCFCWNEKEQTRNGKTSKKIVYTGNYSILENKDDLCIHCGKKGYLKYYYLGMSTKVKNWFKSVDMCRKMLSHWNARDSWLGRQSSNPEKCEFWDGERWVELQWFWDPKSTWTLPTLCPHCSLPVSSDKLLNSPNGKDGSKDVECPNCFENFEHFIKGTNGSPLNLALVGHWDGWQPFGTSYRGCGSLEVSIANMTKNDRSHVEEVYVVGFVPCSQVPNLPEALDPFLQPLLQDISTGFIDGFKVFSYPREIEIEGYQTSEVETVRVLLLCWTGDHPGQCECGKFLNQGKSGCRRCKVVGRLLENSTNTHVYYGENRYHFRYPWEERSIESSVDDMFDIDHETRVSVRKTMSSTKGFTGTSILHKYLYPLYGFDILKHLVFDVFHTICLNVVKNQLERILDMKLIDPSYLDDQVEKFPWTQDLKTGRIPRSLAHCKGTHVGQWKAEGLQKFSFPMADCIFMGKLDDRHELEIQSLVSRLTELHFYSDRRLWNADMIEMHRQLAWRLNIQIEEIQGLHMCTISVHNLTHIHEDIINFSSPDNFWCAVYERAVKQYVKKSHNCKGIEATFAQSESRREFLKPLQAADHREAGKVDLMTVIHAFLNVNKKGLCAAI